MAKNKGFWRKRGLDVDVARGFGSVAATQALGGGQFDFGHAVTPVIILQISKGLPIMSIAQFTYKNTMGFGVLADSPIKTPKDLEGKTVGWTVTSGEVPFFAVFAKQAGIDESKIKFVHITYDPGDMPADFKTLLGSARSTQHVLELTGLSSRRDPVYLDIAGGLTADHVAPIAIIREDEIVRALRRTLPNVRQVHVPYSGASGLSCYVSMKKTVEGQAQQAMITVLSVEYYLKVIVVVDEDIDVFNEREVAWAVLTRSRAEKMTFLPGAMGAVLDPMSDPVTNTITKVGIDATLPLTGTPAERLQLPHDVMQWASGVLARHDGGAHESVR